MRGFLLVACWPVKLEWLQAALYKHEIDESMRPAEVVLVFDCLEKLYGATWLIRQRYGNSTENEEIDNEEAIAEESVGASLSGEVEEP